MSTRTIAQAAAEAGVSADTLRYYERVGLIPTPGRSTSGYRLYDDSTAERVRLIKSTQRMGLRLDAIKELLDIIDRGACPCGHTRQLVEERLADVEAEQRRLSALQAGLTAVLSGFVDCPEPPEGVRWSTTQLASEGGDPNGTS